MSNAPGTADMPYRDGTMTGRHGWLNRLILCTLGALATLGWAPVEWPLVALVSYVLFFRTMSATTSPVRSLDSALFFALGFHLAGHGWAYHALAEHTMAGSSLALLGTTLFVVYLALFTAIPCWAYQVIRRFLEGDRTDRSIPSAGVSWADSLLLASLLTAGESARGWFFNGFNSLSPGYLFSSSEGMRGWLPLLGVYGCAFLFYLVASRLSSVFTRAEKWAPVPISLLAPAGLLGLLLAAGWWLDGRAWTRPDGPPVSFRLIQGGVAQEEKFATGQQSRQVAQYLDAILARPATLIVTPETAFPLEITQLPPSTLNRIQAFSRASNSHVFMGTGSADPSGKGYNSIYHINPLSTTLDRYDKRLLMPFGEFAPTGLHWFTDQLSLAWNDLSPGANDQPAFSVSSGDQEFLVGTLICQEETSGQEVRRWLPLAGVLLNPSNLAWFDGSIAIDQRLQIARTRAIESGRPVLRSTNTGVTAHIDYKGRVVGRIELSRPGELRGFVQPMKELTPYARFGDLFAGWVVLVSLGIALLMMVRRNPQRPRRRDDRDNT